MGDIRIITIFVYQLNRMYFLKGLGLIALLCLLSTCGRRYDDWKVVLAHDTAIIWNAFTWGNDTVEGRIYSRTEMMVPLKMEHMPNQLSFEFNLAAGRTTINWSTLQLMVKAHPEMETRISNMRKPNQTVFYDAKFELPGFVAENHKAPVYGSYFRSISPEILQLCDTTRAGTLGGDLFRGRVLILDYPNKRFAVCDTVPPQYTTDFYSVEINENGQVILPLEVRAKKYRMLFDTHNSIFPILVPSDKVSEIASEISWYDTIKIRYTQGVKVYKGEALIEPFKLGCSVFKSCYVYADAVKANQSSMYDGIVGNALFWDRTVIIDFRKKLFGVK